MRGPRAQVLTARTTVVPAALLLVLSACGILPSTAPTPVTTPPPPVTGLAPVPTTRATPSTTEPLPVPIAMPFEAYADEAVVEYGSIEIPSIGLRHTLYQGVTLHNVDRGPSHWPGTAAPGERGNAVFAGHRVTHSHPFLRIDELASGDEVIFRVGGRRSTYRVTSDLIVSPSDTWIADQTREFTATLYACHPPGSFDYRYVVRMSLVSSTVDT